jgi:hypothetical protein
MYVHTVGVIDFSSSTVVSKQHRDCATTVPTTCLDGDPSDCVDPAMQAAEMNLTEMSSSPHPQRHR